MNAEFVQLHIDIVVEPGREAEMESNYNTIFRPVISRQPGFVAVQLLQLREGVVGEHPKNAQYRLQITFETEEQRETWVASDDHQEVWPEVAKTFQEFCAYLFDVRTP